MIVAVAVLYGRAKGVLVAHLAAAVAGAILLLAVAAREIHARLWGCAGIRPPLRREPLPPRDARLRRSQRGPGVAEGADATLRSHPARALPLAGGGRHVRRAALRLAQVMEEISDPLYFAAFPQLARAWVEARDEFFRLLRLMAAGLAVLTSAVVAVGAIVAPLIVSLALGPAYAAAAEPFRLLLFATGVAVATLWATPAMLGSGHPAAATTAATAGAAVLVVLLVALVPTWGIEGAAGRASAARSGIWPVVLPWLVRAKRRTLRSTR